MESNVKVSVATFGDYDAVSRLMAKYGMATKPEPEWRHLWENNPAWQPHRESWPIGWKLVADGELVGFLGNIPLNYHFQRKKLLASVACEWVVDKPFRKSNKLLTEAYFGQTLPDLFLNTTAITSTGKIFLQNGGHRAPSPDYDSSLFWILSPFSFLRSLFLLKGWKLAEPIALLLSLPFAVFVKLRNLLAENADLGESTSYEYFSPSVEKFLGGFSPVAEKLHCERKIETQSWHYQSAIRDKNLRIFTMEINGAVRSYASFFRQDNPTYQLSRIRLVDFQCNPGSEADITILVARAIKAYQQEKAGMIEVVGFSGEIREMLKKLKPFQRRLPHWMFYYKAKDPKIAEALLSPNAWNACSYDGDGSL